MVGKRLHQALKLPNVVNVKKSLITGGLRPRYSRERIGQQVIEVQNYWSFRRRRGHHCRLRHVVFRFVGCCLIDYLVKFKQDCSIFSTMYEWLQEESNTDETESAILSHTLNSTIDYVDTSSHWTVIISIPTPQINTFDASSSFGDVRIAILETSATLVLTLPNRLISIESDCSSQGALS